jgi:hypothetical protein
MADRDERAPASEIVFYQGEDGRSRIQVRLEEGTVWLPQRLIADLYQVSVPTIHEHIGNIFDEGELEPGPTVRKFRIVQVEGKKEVSAPSPRPRSETSLSLGSAMTARRLQRGCWQDCGVRQTKDTRMSHHERIEQTPPFALVSVVA